MAGEKNSPLGATAPSQEPKPQKPFTDLHPRPKPCTCLTIPQTQPRIILPPSLCVLRNHPVRLLWRNPCQRKHAQLADTITPPPPNVVGSIQVQPNRARVQFKGANDSSFVFVCLDQNPGRAKLRQTGSGQRLRDGATFRSSANSQWSFWRVSRAVSRTTIYTDPIPSKQLSARKQPEQRANPSKPFIRSFPHHALRFAYGISPLFRFRNSPLAQTSCVT